MPENPYEAPKEPGKRGESFVDAAYRAAGWIGLVVFALLANILIATLAGSLLFHWDR